MDPQKAKSIFLHAVEHIAPDEWPNYLSVACSENPALRNEVEVLLAAHQDDGDLADQARQACAEALPTVDQPITEKSGTQIGPYKLLQQLGEGGMGVVYMAEQKEPVRRRVALKIIKPGMDTRQVIVRFEAERQALAMMDHPNIAKVLDAGQTETGRPYFVMELVNGLPVTQYSDEQHLTPKERLELFVPICQAVQHAHQKGIIHRDLKPSNILVALYDGRAVPKIIDFGVAKATCQALTEKTMFTQLGQVVGTMEYMSPEQAERNQLDIDTRSDIYSLGVVLYELLTGETPFDRAQLRSAAFDEMLRVIREEEPSKPSIKVSESRSLPSIAANRRVEPAKLSNIFRGELDWIVLKAMEKDRARRYKTTSEFSADIERYLADEPIQACRPSTSYRVRKFAKRHKVALLTSFAIAASLLIGLSLATWQAVVATNERDRVVAEQERSDALLAFLNEFVFRKAIPRLEKDGDVSLRSMMEQLPTDENRWPSQPPLAEASIRHYVGVTCRLLALPEHSRTHLERAIKLREVHLGADHIDTARSEMALAAGELQAGWRTGNRLKEQVRRLARADALATGAVDILSKRLGHQNPEVLRAACLLSLISHFRGDQERAMQIYRGIKGPLAQLNGRSDEDQLDLQRSLGLVIRRQEVGINPEVDEIVESNYAKSHSLPRYHPHRMFWADWHGYLLMRQGRLDEADEALTKALNDHVTVLHPKNNFVWLSNRLLSILRIRQQDWQAAIRHLEAGRTARPDEPGTTLALGLLYLKEGNATERQRWLELSKELLAYHQETDHPEVAYRTVMLSLAAHANTKLEAEMQEDAIRLSEKFSKQIGNQPSGVLKDPEQLNSCLLFIQALSAYRSGDSRTAVVMLNQLDLQGTPLTRALALTLRASIDRHNQQPGQSHQHLEKARTIRDTLRDKLQDDLNEWDLMMLIDFLIEDVSADNMTDLPDD